jgi:hypothetical protein
MTFTVRAPVMSAIHGGTTRPDWTGAIGLRLGLNPLIWRQCLWHEEPGDELCLLLG